MNKRIEVNTLQEKLTEFLNNIGISGPAEITEDTENNTYTVKIDNYKFCGFYPSTDNSLFTLQVVRGNKELPSGMFVDYIEAFVFFTKDFLPYQFIIYEYPQMQTLYLMDDDHFKKGTIQYEVNCPCSGQRDVRNIDTPAFTSDIEPIAEYVSAFRAQIKPMPQKTPPGYKKPWGVFPL